MSRSSAARQRRESGVRTVSRGLCGCAFAIVIPPGDEETDRDRLCPSCVALPASPQRVIELPLRVAKLFLRLALTARALNAMNERGES